MSERPAPKTDAREARGAETRQRIIGAMWTVTADRGLSALTVRDVAKQAGISHTMVHYHFESKDELILAAVEYAQHYWIHPLEDIVYGPGTPEEKLERVTVWMAEPTTTDVMRVHRQLLAQSEWNERLQTSMAAEYARWRETFVDLFRRLKESGRWTPSRRAIVRRRVRDVVRPLGGEAAPRSLARHRRDHARDAAPVLRARPN